MQQNCVKKQHAVPFYMLHFCCSPALGAPWSQQIVCCMHNITHCSTASKQQTNCSESSAAAAAAALTAPAKLAHGAYG
jgi:hypothetical protein